MGLLQNFHQWQNCQILFNYGGLNTNFILPTVLGSKADEVTVYQIVCVWEEGMGTARKRRGRE